MKHPSRSIPFRIEALEVRIAPASLTIGGAGVGAVGYTAAEGVTNALVISSVSINGINHFQFTDVEPITVSGPGAGVANGSGTTTVAVPVGSLASLAVSMGGDDSVAFSSPVGFTNLSVKTGTITIDAALYAGELAFEVDTLAINADLESPAHAAVSPFTAGRGINLGTENAAQLSLTAAETSNIKVQRLTIGSSESGSVEVSAPVSMSSRPVKIQTGGLVNTTGTGAITTSELDVIAGGSVSLTGENNFFRFAMSAGGGVSFINDPNGFAVGQNGLRNPSGDIVISGGAVSQQTPPDLGIICNGLALDTGSVFFNNPANDINTLAADSSGSVLYVDSDGFSTGTVGGITGVSAGQDVELIADAIAIDAPIHALTGSVTIAPLNDTTAIHVGGADAVGTLGISIAEIERVTAQELVIGDFFDRQSAPTTITAPVNFSGHLSIAGSDITGTAAIHALALTLLAQGSILLSGQNDVDELIVSDSAFLEEITFTDSDGFRFEALADRPDSPLGNLSSAPTLNAGSDAVTFYSERSMVIGNGLDTQFLISGGVILDSGLNYQQGVSLSPGTEHLIITNDGTDPVVGTFDGLPEGSIVPGIIPPARISYVGGDGNDVSIITAPALSVSVAPGGKRATFTDVDGDIVKVEITKGQLTEGNFFGYQVGVPTGGQLLTLGFLEHEYSGTDVSITARPGPSGGNGFVNVGLIYAQNIQLGTVNVQGDLGRILAVNQGFAPGKPTVKSLSVQSIGMLGTSTQDHDGSNESQITGPLGALTVKGDLRGSIRIFGATDGTLGVATIHGSVVSQGGVTAGINTDAGIGTVKIAGDIRNNGNGTAEFVTRGAIGALSVGGSIFGSGTNAVRIEAFGKIVAPSKGLDIAIKNISVKGSVQFTNIAAGDVASAGQRRNADASIGSVAVGGDWIGSRVIAGFFRTGSDGTFFTNNDELGTATDLRNHASISSSIGTFSVAGQALGTNDKVNDMFGVLAEEIGKAKVGARTFAFKAGETKEAFFAAPTTVGFGGENPAFDFILREFGSLTPPLDVYGSSLNITPNGKTATFTDVDGDIVTVKRTAGRFVSGDFGITDVGVGGRLDSLTLTPGPGGLAYSVSITAKPGPIGGNGFVNVGEIRATATDIAILTVGGELQELTAGDTDPANPGIGSLTVHSLSNRGGPFFGSAIEGIHGIGKVTVKTDVFNTGIYSRNQDSSIGSVTVGGSVSGGVIDSEGGVGTVKIGGSLSAQSRIIAKTHIGTIHIGGDLRDTTIEAVGLIANPAKGSEILLKSLKVGGSMENSSATLGLDENADASIGSITVGREWLSSTITAGVTSGVDGGFGTEDDEKTVATIDFANRFSTIASLTVKGQALGTPMQDDQFGVVAEVIGKARIGGRNYAVTSGKDAFAAAPTTPGIGMQLFDFFLREIGQG